MKLRISNRVLTVALVALLVILAGLLVFVIGNREEIISSSYTSSREIRYQGKVYTPRSDVVNVLLLGVDKEGEAVSSGSFLNDGLADFICLCSFDLRKQECRLIHINRDTITDVMMMGVGGQELGKAPMQIALAHQYGDGLKTSCLNTCRAVSDLLGGIPIDYYLSSTIDGICAANDLVDGVTVTIKDDFSEVDSSLVLGTTVTLKGTQAATFVRSRFGMKEATNLSRMERQKDYVSAFYDSFTSKMKTESGFSGKALNALSGYIVTNLSATVIDRAYNKMGDYSLVEVLSLQGESKAEDGVMAFYPDEEQLTELIINCFYQER